jgi:hypothetical protein
VLHKLVNEVPRGAREPRTGGHGAGVTADTGLNGAIEVRRRSEILVEARDHFQHLKGRRTTVIEAVVAPHGKRERAAVAVPGKEFAAPMLRDGEESAFYGVFQTFHVLVGMSRIQIAMASDVNLNEANL